MRKSCFNCSHWQKVDLSKGIWCFGDPPEYECDIIADVERQVSDPQRIIEAGRVGPEQKAAELARQCPRYEIRQFLAPDWNNDSDSSDSESSSGRETFYHDAAVQFAKAISQLVIEKPEIFRSSD